MELPFLPLFALSFSISILLGWGAADFLSLKDDSTSSPFPPNFLFGTASSSYQVLFFTSFSAKSYYIYVLSSYMNDFAD